MDHKLLPLIPVRDVVIFPNSLVHISLKREQSVAALEEALHQDKEVFLTMQKNKDVDNPKTNDLYLVGTIAKIEQTQRLPDGIINIVVKGLTKGKIKTFVQESPFFRVDTEEIGENDFAAEEILPQIKILVEQFKKLIALGKPVSLEVLPNLTDLSEPNQIVDIIISNL